MKSRKDMAVRSVHPIKIFYCYAHEDGELRERLERHLIPLRQRRDITGWFDLDIQAGSDWKRESEAHLDEADIILLLLSADFLASRYGETVEMTRALERHRTGMASIMPILLKPVSWELTPFAMFSPLPTNRKPVTSWANQEEAFLDIAQGIHRVIQTLLSKQAVSQEVSSQQGPLTGQVIGGKYRLGELLGEGGYGQVYKAWNLQLERIQAVKILHDWHFQKREFRERFTREARIVAVLDHPNIIHVDDFDVQSDRAYLVMPFVEGGTLQGVLEKQSAPLKLEQIFFYLEHICKALDYAHAQGVVHLDLKPLNLLVRSDGSLLLADFGLAHLMKQGAIEGGMSLLAGSPYYMAPEHIQGREERRSDFFSLGVILYQMLTGRLPFEGSKIEEIQRKIQMEWPVPIQTLRPELPPAIENVIAKALAKQPEQRYQRAQELLDAFKEVVLPSNSVVAQSALPESDIAGSEVSTPTQSEGGAAEISLSSHPHAPKPYITSPDQSEGDVANIPFFPNPRAKERRERQLDDERQSQTEGANQPTAISRPLDPSVASTLLSEQVAVSASFASPPLSGEIVEEHSPARLQEWYKQGLEAEGQDDLEAAAEAWQHILRWDAGYHGGRLTEEVEALTLRRIGRWEQQALAASQAQNWAEATEAWSALLRLDAGNPAARDGWRESLRAWGFAAYEQGEWGDAIQKWEVFLLEVPNDKLLREHLDAARACQQYEYLYKENVRQFIAENKLKAAETQLEKLYRSVNYYGDPEGLARQIGFPVPPDFPTRYQQRETQAAEQLKQQQQRRQQVKDAGLSGMQWGALTGAVIGVIVGAGLDGASFAGKEWWLGVGAAALGGLVIGFLGGAIGAGLGDSLGDLPRNPGWRVRIFGGTLIGALLGAIIGMIDTIFILNISFNFEVEPYSEIVGFGVIIGAIVGGSIGFFAEDADIGSGVGGCIGGAFLGGIIGYLIAGATTILSKSWSIAMLPDTIAGGLIGLLYSSLVSLAMRRFAPSKINHTSLGAAGAIISTMGGSVLGCVIGLSHQSAQLAFVGAIIGLAVGSPTASLVGWLVGLIGKKLLLAGKK